MLLSSFAHADRLCGKWPLSSEESEIGRAAFRYLAHIVHLKTRSNAQETRMMKRSDKEDETLLTARYRQSQPLRYGSGVGDPAYVEWSAGPATVNV